VGGASFGRCLPFVFLLRIGDEDFATWGGAMTGAEEDEGDVRRVGSAGVSLDSKRRPASGADRSQEAAETALEKYLREIIECILDNVKVGHLPSATLLFNLATRLSRNEEVPEEEYLSFAEELWKSAQEMGLVTKLVIANPADEAKGRTS